MIITQPTTVRPAEASDKNELVKLIHLSTFVHRHLDWRPPLAWISHPPFLIIERMNRIIAALSCAPELQEIAWIRVFAHDSTISSTAAWEILWPETLRHLQQMETQTIAAIPIQKWIKEILQTSDFNQNHNIVTLVWDQKPVEDTPSVDNIRIRPMAETDIPRVAAIDKSAFEPLWQHTPDLIELAFSQSCSARVAEDQSGLIGYQITTPTQYGAHLGRLAVHPRSQGRGVATALLRELQSQILNQNLGRLSVNTQDSNDRSIRLYSKVGFFLTSESYPVYQLKI